MELKTSRNLLERARRVIPSATQTFSKGSTQWPRADAPNYLTRGTGAWVWDADGNKFLDYLMALGPIILGYGDKRVDAACARQMAEGTVFSQMHPLEVEVAEMLVDIIPCAEMVRFGKSGSDVTTAAIRAARAYTSRDHVIMCGYHGWHDWCIGTTTRDLGVPRAVAELTQTFAYNNVASLEAALDARPGQVAAVIMEPVGVIAPEPGFLEAVRDLAHRHGALLIYDEVVTGFRTHLGGAQERFGVIPDLACFGKAMANGYPLSAVVGKRDVMEVFDKIFYSGTFGGETVSLAAGKATIEALRDTDALARIQTHGTAFMAMAERLIEENGLRGVIKVKGFPERFLLDMSSEKGDLETRTRKTYLMQECARRGLLYYCLNVTCAAHGPEELAFSENVFREMLPLFARAHQADDFAARLQGPAIEPVFRQP